MAKFFLPGWTIRKGEGVDHGIHLHPDFFSDLENYNKGEMSLDYKEIYATLNTVQLRKLGSIIDMALRTRMSAYEVMLFLSKSDIKLNNDQFELFWVIVKYIVKNREHIKEVIYEAMKKEFFDSMDQLMAEQKKG